MWTLRSWSLFHTNLCYVMLRFTMHRQLYPASNYIPTPPNAQTIYTTIKSINQKAFIVSSTVIKIHSNHGNIRHNRNK